MPARPAFIRPWNYSETLLRGFANQPPFKGCGLSTDAHGTGMATLLESATARNGRLVSKRVRTNTLKRGWRAFTRVADSNGIPDTDDLVRIHRAMFPGLPDPIRLFTRNWDDVMDRAKSGYAISIALRLSALGSRNSIDFTTADHQALFWGPKGDEAWVMGPMRPHSDGYSGHRAPLAQLRKASKAIENGLIITWLYPIGGWTKAAQQAKTQRIELRKARAGARRLRGRIESKNEVIATQRERIAELEAGQPVDCAAVVARALDDERVAIRDLVEDRRV